MFARVDRKRGRYNTLTDASGPGIESEKEKGPREITLGGGLVTMGS